MLVECNCRINFFSIDKFSRLNALYIPTRRQAAEPFDVFQVVGGYSTRSALVEAATAQSRPRWKQCTPYAAFVRGEKEGRPGVGMEYLGKFSVLILCTCMVMLTLK